MKHNIRKDITMKYDIYYKMKDYYKIQHNNITYYNIPYYGSLSYIVVNQRTTQKLQNIITQK